MKKRWKKGEKNKDYVEKYRGWMSLRIFWMEDNLSPVSFLPPYFEAGNMMQVEKSVWVNLDSRALSLTESKYWWARSGKYIALGSRLAGVALLKKLLCSFRQNCLIKWVVYKLENIIYYPDQRFDYTWIEHCER